MSEWKVRRVEPQHGYVAEHHRAWLLVDDDVDDICFLDGPSQKAEDADGD